MQNGMVTDVTDDVTRPDDVMARNPSRLAGVSRARAHESLQCHNRGQRLVPPVRHAVATIDAR